MAKFKIADLDLDAAGDDIPAPVLSALTTQQYLALLDAEHGPFEALNPAEEVPLTGLSKAIEILVARGATSNDFKEIYCENCDFSTTSRSFDGAHFDRAYLVGADFSHVRLRGAFFTNADIGRTNFFDADLRMADLKADVTNLEFDLPLLECAKLVGADLSGRPLVLFQKYLTSSGSGGFMYSIEVPIIKSAELDASTTTLDSFAIVTVVNISDDDYLKQHPDASEVKLLLTDRGGVWENPLARSYWQTGDLSRSHIGGGTETNVVIRWRYDAARLKLIGKDAFMLRGFVDHSALMMLPLYSQFVEAVTALDSRDTNDRKAAQSWSDEAAKSWQQLKPISCSDHLTSRKLLLFNPGLFNSD